VTGVNTKASGFSLLEVVVAMGITGTAVALAAALLVTLADRTATVRSAGQRMDQEANAERLLLSLIRNVDAGVSRDQRLVGDPHQTEFGSWCTGPTGRPAQCSVRLLILMQEERFLVRVQVTRLSAPDTLSLDLWTERSMARLLYLADPAGAGRWLDEWTMAPFPFAIGLALDRDTLVFPVVPGA
jgi:type II secretory pathway pseudopilin PulG